MEPWLQPLFDAEGMRAVDRWAIEEQGIPRRAADGERRARRWPRPSPSWRRRARCGSSAARATTAATAWSRRAVSRGARLRGRAARRDDLSATPRPRATSTPGWRGSGAVVDAIFGTGFTGAPREPAAAAIEAINRCGAPVVACDIASGVDASSGEVEGAAVEADLTVSLPRRQGRPAGRARQVAHGRAAGRRRSASRPGRRPSPAAGDDRPGRARRWRRRAAPHSTKFSSGQVTIAGGSRGLTGAVRMSSTGGDPGRRRLRDRRRPRRPRAGLRSGRAGGDVGRLPGRRRLPGAGLGARRCSRAFERAAAGVLGPGLGRDQASLELVREVAPADRGAAGDRRRRPQRLRRAARADRRPRRRRPSSPRTPASSAACSGASPRRSTPTALAARARGRARRRRRRRAQGRRHDRHRRRAGRRQRDLGARPWRPPGPATSSPGSSRRCSPAASSPSPRPAPRSLAHARAGREAARRIGAAESVIATDVIDVDPGGAAARAAPSNNLGRR